jgi:hypothetical protein
VIIIGGAELVTAADVQARWGDVGAARLRGWCQPTLYRAALLAPVTVGQVCALTGSPIPPGTDPHAPARLPGPTGDQNLYEWAAVVRADRLARAATRGRSRRTAT